jgi:hypothetical protein
VGYLNVVVCRNATIQLEGFSADFLGEDLLDVTMLLVLLPIVLVKSIVLENINVRVLP